MKNIKKFGGLLSHGIPDFRLPREVIKNSVKKILDLGVELCLGKELGKDFTIENLKEKYDAVLLSFGANVSSKMNIERRKPTSEYMEVMNF